MGVGHIYLGWGRWGYVKHVRATFGNSRRKRQLAIGNRGDRNKASFFRGCVVNDLTITACTTWLLFLSFPYFAVTRERRNAWQRPKLQWRRPKRRVDDLEITASRSGGGDALWTLFRLDKTLALHRALMNNGSTKSRSYLSLKTWYCVCITWWIHKMPSAAKYIYIYILKMS